MNSKLSLSQMKARNELVDAFYSTKSTDQMLNAFNKMEAMGPPAFHDNDLCLASLHLGLQLHKQGVDPTQVLPFAVRGFKHAESDANGNGNGKYPPLHLVTALVLMGSVHLGLKKIDDCLGYLNRANVIMGKLFDEGKLPDIEHVWQFHAVQLDKAKAYVDVENYEEALPFCLKVVELDLKKLGRDDVMVGYRRKMLGIIYSGLGERVKALKQCVLAGRIFRKWNMKSDVVQNEMDAAKIMTALGRYDEAVVTLKCVVKKMDEENETRVRALLKIAKVLCKQDKFEEGKMYLEIAVGILDERARIAPMEVAESYSKISMLYESMNEFETAISLLKRTLALVEKLPQEQQAVVIASARIGLLLLLKSKAPQAIPYLESAAERMKNSTGPKHFILGDIYNNLGVAYFRLGRPESAAEMFALAKDAMNVSHGAHHAITIAAWQNLSKAYGEMGSYDLAVDVQQQVIKAWESLGARAENELREARQLLEHLEKKAPGFYAKLFLMKIESFGLTTDTIKILDPELPAQIFIV